MSSPYPVDSASGPINNPKLFLGAIPMKRDQKLRSLLALSLLLPTVFLTTAVGTMSSTQPGVAQIPGSPTDIQQNPGAQQQLPTVKVIKQEFTHAKGWRITWNGGIVSSDNWTKIQSIFSTVTGSVNSIHFLNNTSWENTDNADFMLYSGDLTATSEISQLTKKSALHATTFKLTSMKVNELEDAAKNNPNLFGTIYALAFDQATTTKPDYKAGQIYVFKTARASAKYGAVRVVSMSPRVIEVVVQK
jgi:hypothetical protein